MIYTNVIGLNIKKSHRHYDKLGDTFVEWIKKTCIDLYTKRNKYEEKASEILKKMDLKFEPQCFFFDSITKQTYFLDFLIIDKNIAIEIDGASHISKVQSDKERDKFFVSLGIKTIRIKNEQLSFCKLKNSINLLTQKKENKRKKDNKQIEMANRINSMIKIYNKKYKAKESLIDIKQ